MKKFLSGLAKGSALLLCIALFSSNISARGGRYDFSGNAVPNWNVVAAGRTCYKTSNSSYVYLDYVAEKNINIRFTLRDNANNELVGEQKQIYNTGFVTLPTGTIKGHRYDLLAGREYFYDRACYVEGTWTP